MHSSSLSTADLQALNDRVLEVLKEAVGRRTSARALSEQLGHSHNYVRRLLSGEIPLQMETLQDVLLRLGLPPQLFFDQVFQGRAVTDPVAVLCFYREGDGLPRDPFLDEIEPRIEVLLEKSIDHHAEVDGRRTELDALEERRFEDREGAKDALEELICSVLDQCERLDDEVPSRHVADLACACSIWAVIQRVSGYRDNSCDMYVLAFRCLRRADLHLRTTAECLQRAAYLLRDLDALWASLHFLRQAGDLFLRSGDLERFGQTLVDNGNFYFSLDRISQAKAEFEAALRLLPASAIRHRAAAFQGLARISEEEDDITSAIDNIRAACELYAGRIDIVAAQFLVVRGRIARRLDLEAEAEDCFSSAMRMYEQVGHPGYVLLAALEYAGLLLAFGRTQRLSALADEMFSMAKHFRKNRIIDSALMEFVRMAKWGELTEELLASTKKRLEAAS